ncbi:MAG TPA: glutaminyl-peptide cyclotransferase [Puia sp.]|jgi:glutamine cyclotransferase|nr:glutaminyl-peptide cyclotransferase [Puia sp.]
MKVRLLFLLLLAGCTGNGDHKTPDNTTTMTAVPNLNFTVGSVYKHDTTSYTEGFLFHDHQLFESSGATPEYPRTRSLAGVVDLKTGKIEKKVELDKARYFGEGIAFFKNRFYQLTYKNHTGFIYDAATYKRLDSFRFQNEEGWALTADSNSLIMSDGTSTLTYLDPVNCKPVKTLAVTESGMALDSLNELEYINGYIYANRYLQNYIVKIEPASGKVVGRLDLTSLVDAEHVKNPGGDVLNGIAYDRDNDKIYVTGKLWSGIYQLIFTH